MHHCKPVKAWLAEQEAQIDVLSLPSDSPALNPNEMANAELRHVVTKRAAARTQLQVLKAAASHLRRAQRQPDRIKSHFQHAPIRYAA